MRGQRSYDKLFQEEKQNDTARINGRSKELIKKRNEALLHRYYFIHIYTRWHYSDVINRLSQEFYLSPIMVTKIIQANLDTTLKLKKEKPSAITFKRLHPHFDWNTKLYINAFFVSKGG